MANCATLSNIPRNTDFTRIIFYTVLFFSQTGQMIELCCEYLSVRCIWLYVLIKCMWIYQMSFSHHQKSSNVFQSLSSLTMSRIFSSATAVAVHFGWNSSAFMFTLFSLTSLVVLFDSHCYYNGYKNCINEFLTSSLSNRPGHIVFMPFIIDLSCSFFVSEITSSLRAPKKSESIKKIWIKKSETGIQHMVLT